MSDKHPAENWYRSSPVGRSRVGQQRIDEIQRQINTLENQQKDRSTLIHKLNRLNEVEKGKKELQDKVLVCFSFFNPLSDDKFYTLPN